MNKKQKEYLDKLNTKYLTSLTLVEVFRKNTNKKVKNDLLIIHSERMQTIKECIALFKETISK